MIQLVNLEHRYGSNILFDKFSWHIKPGTRTALVGPNGSGKTTLFQIAIGKMKPDAGDVTRSKGTVISLFQQIPDFDPEATILETALSENKLYNDYSKKLHRIHDLMEKEDPSSHSFEKLLEEQSEMEDFAQAHDLHNLEVRAKKILTGLGFSQEGLDRPVKSYSPGYQHRLGLSIALLNSHNLLFLDEPTNHLDDSAKEWLADYLVNQNAAYVLVTHDPEFLNKTTRSITEIHSKGVYEFEGTLDEFFEAKNEIQEKLQKQFDKEEAYLKSRNEWVERFRAKTSKARAVQSVIKKLEKREKIDSPEDSFWNSKPEYVFKYEEASRISFRITDGAYSYSANSNFIFQNANLEINNGDKVALVGPNGAGKSTFLRCAANIRELSKGNSMYGPRTKIGYFSQTHSEDLDPEKNLLQTVLTKFPQVPEVEARSLLGHFAFPGDTVFKMVKSLSGGEQSRLRLALLVNQPTNCLMLDEPTNHLDIVVRDALKRALIDYKGSVIVISHDPEFLTGLCDRTYQLAHGELKNLNVGFADYLKYHKEDEQEGISKLSSKEDKLIIDNQNQSLSKSARNQAKNKIKNLEKEGLEIEKRLELLEKNKKEKEELLADPSFFKNRSYQSELDAYNDIKNEIARLTIQWEDAQLELESLKEKVN
ncbi:ABC-F family ATP-binding cassette domain-containing protein [Leptospira sp. GIMC2001]|uniref:ABC-F family ATP-binding cassette domain-containing protein n=1 Tax=Leptospira sp. GIMC2001 TaxID=1513297 RepID=UPI00234A7E89|nr:ABC-F family ATP-binding cassette domain-containing protein [Leptospira sp. GIMC2001]WCL49878.1 ABC-F family ATP-binding cassette domain-containing protein [Leptospira sp. GIMC2001]